MNNYNVKTKKMKTQNIAGLLVLLCMTILSCSKTEYEQEERPYTDIISFYIDDQYVGEQKLQGVISGDRIIVYWNPEVTPPMSISPSIQLGAGATISPASGTAVPFSEETIYTVTAENGTTKEYQLQIKTQREIPLLTGIVASYTNPFPVEELFWRVGPNGQANSGYNLNLLGEYFLATGESEDIKVYMQRLHDGYEFDLDIVQSSITNTSMQVELPNFSNQLDTGRHRIWVQVGDLASESKDLYLRAPNLQQYGTVEVELMEAGWDVYAGQDLHINYKYSDDLDGAFTRYYEPNNFHSVVLSVRILERIDTTINPRTGQERYTNVFRNGNYVITDVSVSSDVIQFKLPEEIEEFVGGTLRGITLAYKYINIEGLWTHLSGNTVTTYGQALQFPYSLSSGINPETGEVRSATIVSAKNQN